MTLRWGQLCLGGATADTAPLIRVAWTVSSDAVAVVGTCILYGTNAHSESPRLDSPIQRSTEAEPAGRAPTRSYACDSRYHRHHQLLLHNTGRCLGLPWNRLPDTLGTPVPRPSLAFAEKLNHRTSSASALRLSQRCPSKKRTLRRSGHPLDRVASWPAAAVRTLYGSPCVLVGTV